MRKTPRQISALLENALARKHNDAAVALSHAALAARGDGKELQKQIQSLTKE